jgi:hypothetical protein
MAIKIIAQGESLGVINMSHGQPITLRALAEKVFDFFGQSQLLRVGSLPDLPDENYDKIFHPSEIIQQVSFRDTLPAIIKYMRDCYLQKK